VASIAIITSTEFGRTNLACFQAGLVTPLDERPQPTILNSFASYGDYNIAVLRKLVRDAVSSDPRPDLAIAADGLAARAAALELQAGDPKFIFLSTDELEGSPVALAGGVNMNAPGADNARRILLKERYPKVRDASMYLVVNNNSPMALNDAKNWPPDRVVRCFDGVDNPERNEQTTDESNHFIAEFHKLAQRRPAPSGLVIGADPYFWYYRTALVIAVAEKLPIPVCYPFYDFVDASAKTANKGNSIALNKPPLNNASDGSDETTAYFQLGRQVGKFINGAAEVGVSKWTGSEWELQSRPQPPEAPIKAYVSGEEMGTEVRFTAPPQVWEYLGWLARNTLLGKTEQEVARQVLINKLTEMRQEDYRDRPKT